MRKLILIVLALGIGILVGVTVKMVLPNSQLSKNWSNHKAAALEAARKASAQRRLEMQAEYERLKKQA